MRKTIVVVGSINLDLVTKTVRLPIVGETLSGESFKKFFGGKGANQAVAIAKLGAEVAMIGRVGNDSFGKELKHALTVKGVYTRAVRSVSGESGVAAITTDSEGHNSIVVVAGANAMLTPEALLIHRKELERASIVMAQLETPIETVELAASIADENGIPFILDPAPARKLSSKLMKMVTWLTPNVTESALLLGRSTSSLGDETVARELLKMGCRNVILKLGARGAFMAGADVPPTKIGAPSVQVIDTTAAGDAFNGAFAAALARGDSPAQSGMFAATVASLSVTREGAQASMPTELEVARFLRSQGALRRSAT